VRTSRTLDEHLTQLSDVLASPPARSGHEAFLRAFVRPLGLEVPATPVFAAGVSALARTRVEAASSRPLAGRMWLTGFRRLAGSPRYRAWMMDEEDRRVAEWRDTKAQARAAHRRAGLDEQQRAEAEERLRAQRTAP